MLHEKLILEETTVSALDAGFAAAFGGNPDRYFSAPGRTEIGGNHTDHQRGRVLAGAVYAVLCHPTNFESIPPWL